MTRFRGFRAAWFFLAVLPAMLLSCSGGRIHVIQVNSLRAQIYPVEKDGVKTGGFALLSSHMQALRKSAGSDRVYAIAVYNAIHGTPEAFFTQGKVVVELLNELRFDALVVGVREFYFGQEALASLAGTARFPLVSANLVDAAGAIPPWLKPYFRDPARRTAFIGLTPRQVLKQNLPADVKGLLLVPDDADVVRKYVAELRASGIERIGLFAGGAYYGSEEGTEEAAYIESLLAVEGVDQFYFGSAGKGIPDGAVAAERNGRTRTVIVQSGAVYTNGFRISSVAMGGSGSDAIFSDVAVDSSDTPPDPAFSKRLYDMGKDASVIMDQVLADCGADLTLEFESECSMGDLVADILRERSGTQVFLVNSGKIRAAFGKGPVTRRDAWDALPFGGNIVITRLTGEAILKVLERSCFFVGNAKAGRSFLQVSGISFAYDPSRPLFAQVLESSVRIGGIPLDRKAVYSVGTEAFIFGGGDGFVEFGNAHAPSDFVDTKSILTVLQDALKASGTVSAPSGGRIVRL